MFLSYLAVTYVSISIAFSRFDNSPALIDYTSVKDCELPCILYHRQNVLSFALGVMSLLRPLLLDVVPTVQQTAALALGRLANYNDDLAEAVVKGDILPQLVYSLAEQNVRTSYA